MHTVTGRFSPSYDGVELFCNSLILEVVRFCRRIDLRTLCPEKKNQNKRKRRVEQLATVRVGSGQPLIQIVRPRSRGEQTNTEASTRASTGGRGWMDSRS